MLRVSCAHIGELSSTKHNFMYVCIFMCISKSLSLPLSLSLSLELSLCITRESTASFILFLSILSIKIWKLSLETDACNHLVVHSKP